MTTWLTVSIVALVVQILYWRALAKGFSHAISRPGNGDETPVSIIVAAFNEGDRLPGLLNALSEQSATAFELIVADDGSTDSTSQILADANKLFAPGQFKTIRINEPIQPRKKNALTTAIAEARFDQLLFTDADCLPGPDWVRAMQQYLSRSEDRLVIGYSPFEKRNGLLNLFARYETFVTGYYTAAAVGLNRPYMAVGRNIAYSKKVFDNIAGFEHSQHVLSGDDDLLVQEVFKTNAARILHASDCSTFVESEAPRTLREWLRQKTRHTSTGTSYLPEIQIHLLLFHVSTALLWLLPIFGGLPSLGVLVVRQLIQFVSFRRGAEAFRETDLVTWQPILELGYVVYTLLIAPIGVVLPRNKW